MVIIENDPDGVDPRAYICEADAYEAAAEYARRNWDSAEMGPLPSGNKEIFERFADYQIEERDTFGLPVYLQVHGKVLRADGSEPYRDIWGFGENDEEATANRMS